jgi:hypothetical protein
LLGFDEPDNSSQDSRRVDPKDVSLIRGGWRRMHLLRKALPWHSSSSISWEPATYLLVSQQEIRDEYMIRC